MNIAMEQTEEYVDGQLKAKYGDTFIRGNNGTPSLRTCGRVYVLRRHRVHSCKSCCAVMRRSSLHQHAEEALLIPTL